MDDLKLIIFDLAKHKIVKVEKGGKEKGKKNYSQVSKSTPNSKSMFCPSYDFKVYNENPIRQCLGLAK